MTSQLLLLTVCVIQGEPLVDVATYDPRFIMDIRYATDDNFAGRKVYEEGRCVLLRSVAEKVRAAQALLDQRHPGLRLMFKDCYRPDRAQVILWNAVKGTPKAGYVANPHTRTGSIHSYGAAVDLTLADADGRELDMGTPYDHLGPLSEPRYERTYLRKGKLTKAHLRHRRWLRTAMEGAGFKGLRNEWWHFNAEPASIVRQLYRRLDVPFTAVPTTTRTATVASRP